MKRLYGLCILHLFSAILISETTTRLDSLVLSFAPDYSKSPYTSKLKFTYNDQNQVTSEVIENGLNFMTYVGAIDPLGSGPFNMLITYEYDVNGLLSQQIIQTDFTDDWEPFGTSITKCLYSYSTEGLVTRIDKASYIDFFNEWSDSSTITFDYENRHVIRKSTSYQNQAQSSSDIKTEYTYADNGELLRETTYFFDGSTGDIIEYAYKNNKLSTETKLHTYAPTGDIENSKFYEYLYDEKNNLNQIFSKSWIYNYKWADSEKKEITIEPNSENERIILPEYALSFSPMQRMISGKVTSAIGFIMQNASYKKYEEMQLYWSIAKSTGTKDIKTSMQTIRPNPNKGAFTIRLDKPSTITALNLNGQVVFQQFLPNGTHEIVLQNPQKGIYILQIKADDSIDNQKFIVK